MAANEYEASRASGSPLALPTNGAETVVLTTAPSVVFNNPGGPGNIITGTLYLTPGTGSTTATVKVRQGTAVAGTLVDTTPALTVVAGAPISISYTFADTSALAINSGAAGLQYSVTVSTGGTTGAGSVYGAVEVTGATTAS